MEYDELDPACLDDDDAAGASGLTLHDVGLDTGLDLGLGSGDDLAHDLGLDTLAVPAPDPATPDLPNYDGTNGEVIAGSPLLDGLSWHQQAGPTTCAVVSQEFVLEQLTGQPFDESQLEAEALQHGWYEPGTGTPPMHMDSLLEAHGVPTETHFNGTLTDVQTQLGEGNKVIVFLDADEIWEPGTSVADDLGEPPGGKANHAVEVTGLVRTDHGEMVVLNDPGSPDGHASMVPAAEFEAAWQDGQGFYIAAGPNADDSINAFGGHALPAAGTSTAYGETTDGDPVSYSHTDGTYYNDRTGHETKPVSPITGT